MRLEIICKTTQSFWTVNINRSFCCGRMISEDITENGCVCPDTTALRLLHLSPALTIRLQTGREFFVFGSLHASFCIFYRTCTAMTIWIRDQEAHMIVPLPSRQLPNPASYAYCPEHRLISIPARRISKNHKARDSQTWSHVSIEDYF